MDTNVTAIKGEIVKEKQNALEEMQEFLGQISNAKDSALFDIEKSQLKLSKDSLNLAEEKMVFAEEKLRFAEGKIKEDENKLAAWLAAADAKLAAFGAKLEDPESKAAAGVPTQGEGKIKEAENKLAAAENKLAAAEAKLAAFEAKLEDPESKAAADVPTQGLTPPTAAKYINFKNLLFCSVTVLLLIIIFVGRNDIEQKNSNLERVVVMELRINDLAHKLNSMDTKYILSEVKERIDLKFGEMNDLVNRLNSLDSKYIISEVQEIIDMKIGEVNVNLKVVESTLSTMGDKISTVEKYWDMVKTGYFSTLSQIESVYHKILGWIAGAPPAVEGQL